MGRRSVVPKGKVRQIIGSGKPQPNKFYPIAYEYTWHGKVLRKSTGIKALIKDWNKDKRELRASYGDDYVRLNNRLKTQISKFDAALLEYDTDNPRKLNADTIKSFLNDQPSARKDKGYDFATYAEELLKSKLSRHKIQYSRYKNGVSALRMFGEFLASEKRGTHENNAIYVGEMSCELLQAHIDWRRNVKQNKDETINHALTPILYACKAACENGFIDRETNAALQDMRIEVIPSIDEDSKEYDGKSLTKEQLREIISYYENCKETRRREFIEMFLFAFHACGLRVVDIMTLKWANVDLEKKELTKILVKNRKRHTIPLSDAAICILKSWKKKDRRKSFVFDLVPDDLKLSDEKAVYKARNNVTRCIDQSLTVVGKDLNLPFNLTMHVARHTFAVCALNDNTNISVVSQLLGHASTDVTERVYAKFLPETLKGEVSRLGYNFLPKSLSK